MEKFKIKNHIDETGDINLQRCFHEAYGCYPLCYSPYIFQGDNDSDDKYSNGEVKLDFESFRDEFIKVLSENFNVRTINYRLKDAWNAKYTGFSKNDDMHIICYYNNTVDFFVYYDPESEEEAMRLANETFVSVFKKHLKEKIQPKNTINMLIQTQSGFDLVPCEINPIELDINENFNDDFNSVHDVISESIEKKGSGLIILHGKQGSGKTTYIRHTINTHNKRFIMLNNNVMNCFTDPGFLNFLMNQKDSVIIVEDCEQLLRERSQNTFNNGISSILNITDGIYSDILNIKIIATFNSKLTDIDPALLRKGRLIAKYDFQELCLEKTNKLLETLGHPKSDKPLTLAEIYNYEEMNFDKNTKKTIGFN